MTSQGGVYPALCPASLINAEMALGFSLCSNDPRQQEVSLNQLRSGGCLRPGIPVVPTKHRKSILNPEHNFI